MAAIFPPQNKGGVPPGPNVCNGFSPTHPVIGEGPSYVAPDCTTTLTDCQLNALVSELLAAVDELGFPYNSNRIDNLGQALRSLFDGIMSDLDGKVNLAGDTMTGALILPGPPANDNEATTRAYVDGQNSALDSSLRSYIDSETASIMTAAQNLVAALDAAKVNRGGDQMTGPLLLAGDPTNPIEAVSKAYVDNIFVSEGHFVDAPMDGQLWGRQSAAWQPAVSIDGPSNLSDAQQTQWRQSIAAAPLDAMAYNGMQLNGGMEISQERGATPLGINNQNTIYVLDNWLVTTTAYVQAEQSNDAPPGFANSIELLVLNGQDPLTGMETTTAYTLIEGFRIKRLALGTPQAKPFSIGFWIKKHRPGFYSGCVRNEPATDRTFIFPYTINAPDTWEYKTATIPPISVGVFPNYNVAALHIQFNMAAGPGRLGPTGQWITTPGVIAANGNINGAVDKTDYMRLTGLVVLPGIMLPTADQSPLLQRPYEHEQLFCKRYYYAILPAASGVVGPNGLLLERLAAPHPLHMRSNAPAVSLMPPVSVFDGAGTTTIASIGANYTTSETLEFDANAASALVAYRPARIFQTDSGVVGKIAVNARM